VQSELVKATGLSNRGVKTANLHVLRETNMPAILTECGFITNRKEAALLESDAFRRKCAQAIVTAIASQYGLKLKAVSKPNAQPKPNPQPKPQQPAKKEVLKVPGPFKDVPGDRWSAKAIENLKAKGILNGRSDGTFGPTEDLTREEAAVLIDNLLKYLGK
ncbi:MAG: N-acetylmuramoyl-L-alanine amidase, partial [Tuberibacillus sp.]